MYKPSFVFFGSSPLGVATLNALENAGYLPSTIVTGPDAIVRKKVVPPPEKTWALERGIPVFQPTKIDIDFISQLSTINCHLFIVAAYGKILPKALLNIPKHGTLNVHPSLLPKLRGPSPIRTAILNDDRDVGVSIMLLDEEMDHGSILAQKKVPVPEWPMGALALEELLAREGAKLLVQVIPEWLAGNIEPGEQNHDLATYCSHIKKEDGHINLTDDPHKNLLKIHAYEGWPGAYTFFEHKYQRIRIQILEAHIDNNNNLLLDHVRPEGKKEMSFEDFTRGLKK